MNKSLLPATILLVALSGSAIAQLTPQEAVMGMERGINLGNSLDAPTETTWGNPPIEQRYFSDYKDAGFTAIRIPVTWGGYTSTTPPYAIDSTFMNRVQQVVDWALQQGLFVVMDAHHESWLKDALADTATDTTYADTCIARFDSIWSQIATRFAGSSDSLIFEMLNEPYPMSDSNVNALNARVLKIIRRTNPTRIVSFSGYMWSNSDQLVKAAIPDSSDKYLIGYYHSYDPWPFGLQGPGTYGSPSDIATTKAKFDQVTAWSKANSIPVILDEYGFIDKCAYNSRMCAYATDVDQAIQHGVGAFAWDDGGGFAIYNRTTHGFNEIKDILIHTYPTSPDRLAISEATDGTVKLQWANRNTESDSIKIERGVGAPDFKYYATLPATATTFVDSSTTADSTYYYRLSITRQDSTELQSYPIMIKDTIVTAVIPAGKPTQFSLSNNYPNPFNPATVISYSVPKYERVTLKVYDVLGRLVETLVDREVPAGEHKAVFNGSRLASGVYIDRLTSDSKAITRKMILVK